VVMVRPVKVAGGETDVDSVERKGGGMEKGEWVSRIRFVMV